MNAVFFLILFALALVAAGFAAWPLWRRKTRPPMARAVLALALTLLILGIGGGAYLMLGRPALGVRALTGPSDTDLAGLVGTLSRKMVRNPGDERGWILLGRGYLSLNDPSEAARSYGEAIAIAESKGRKDAELYSAYGEALVRAGGGAVGSEAETAFRKALAINAKDPGSRFFLGLALASRGKKDEALALWQGLLADTPANAPWRADLVDRIAVLTAQSNGGAPDISAMVAGLAERLKQNPADVPGWQRLIRAYTVLGEKEKAQSALGDARKALAGDLNGLAAVEAEAKTLKLTD